MILPSLKPGIKSSNLANNQEVPAIPKEDIAIIPVTKPVVLIVHGAYFAPDSWAPFTKILSEAGFEVHCPRLPTVGDTRPPQHTFADDVKAVRKDAIELATNERNIIVLAHSYGGVVASEAIDHELCAHSRPAQTGGVVKMILLNAWLPLKGTSMKDMLDKHGMKSNLDFAFNNDGTVLVKNAADAFFNDVEPAGRAVELASNAQTQNWSTVDEKISTTPWAEVPTTYIHCTQDKAIWPELQEAMVKDAVLIGGAKDLRMETLDAGHSPQLSLPKALMVLFEKIASTRD